MQKDPNPNIQEIQDTMRRPNLRIIGIDENEDYQLKRPVNIFNKIIEENFYKERDTHEYTRSLQNSKQTRPEKKFLLTHNNQNTKCTKQQQKKNIKSNKGKYRVTYKGRSTRIKQDFSPETMKARDPGQMLYRA